MDMEKFNPMEVNEGKVKEQYQVTINNKFASLENLEDNGNINTAWNTIRQNFKISTKESIGHCESQHHKPQFNEDVQNWLFHI
jgi:hypothetical protein